MVEPGQPALMQLEKVFTRDILLPDGSLNRRKLAALVFSHEGKKRQLEAILYPAILSRMESAVAMVRQEGKSGVLLDAPTLYESGADRFCHRVIAVLAPMELRLRRIIERDGLTREQALTRIQAQPSDAFYLERTKDILYNDGEPEKLERQLISLYDELFPL